MQSPMQSQFIDTKSLRMHYLESGRGQPVIAIHGWPESSQEWTLMAPYLGEGIRLLAPDTRGHGQTEAPAQGYDRATLAQDIVDFMDALGIDRCPVIAHDWGGIIATKLALDHGDRVERLCLMDTITTGWPKFVQYFYWFMDGDRAEKFFKDHAEDFIRSIVGGQNRALPQPPDCPFEFQAPDLTAPEVWASDAHLEPYWRSFQEGHDARVSCAYYRSMQFHRVIEDASAPHGERYEPVSHDEMGRRWREQTIEFEYLDYGVEDRHKSYDGETLWLYAEAVMDVAGASINDAGLLVGDPAFDSFSRLFPNIKGQAMGGGHFFIEARPKETGDLVTSFLSS